MPDKAARLRSVGLVHAVGLQVSSIHGQPRRFRPRKRFYITRATFGTIVQPCHTPHDLSTNRLAHASLEPWVAESASSGQGRVPACELVCGPLQERASGLIPFCRTMAAPGTCRK